MGYAAGQNSARQSGGNRPKNQGSGRRPQNSAPRPKPSGSGSGGGSGVLKIVGIVLVVLLVLLVGKSLLSDTAGGITKSTQNREKLDGNKSFNSACVVDSLSWLDDVKSTKEGLRYFYKTTGVQPYVVFLEYDKSLKTEKQKDNYARKWYKNHVKDENSLVFIYFGTDHEGEGDPGYMTLTQGKRIDSIMDDEADEIFWDYLDKNWMSDDLSESEVIVNTFKETADRMMTKTRTAADVLIWLIIAVIILGGLLLLIRIRNQKRRHEAERAKETEQILNTPLEKSRDELLEKYTKE